jgi:hypothetical protein
MRQFYYTFILMMLTLICHPQNGITAHPNWYIKPYINAGVVVQHRSILHNLIRGYPITYELNIVKPTLGNKLWHHENNFPDIGLNLSLIDYANPQQLGYGIIAAPFAEIPLNANKKNSRLILRLCWGPAFMSKSFDIKENQKNGAIGSFVNAYVQFKWFWQIDVNDKVRLEPGFMFSHISNGRGQSPNLGLNVIGVGMGINFKTNSKTKEVLMVDSNTANKNRHEIYVLNSYGINDGEVMGKKQLVSSLSVTYHYNKRNTHKFGLGLEVFHEENYIKDLRVAGLEDSPFIQQMRYGPKLAYSYNLGRVSFPLEMGVYVGQLIEPDGLFFHRLGVRYFGEKGLVLAFGMRSHWAVAYNFDFGIGYRFKLK